MKAANHRSAIRWRIRSAIGPILCIYFMARAVEPKFPPKAAFPHG
jgi:hypothetical protein